MRKQSLYVPVALCVAALAAVRPGSHAAEGPVARIPSGVVGAHLVGRVVVAPDGVCEILGYHPFIDGLGPLFAGEPSEGTAYISVRSEPFRMRAVLNGTTVHLFAAPISGTTVPLRIYFDPTPNRDYANPDSFSTGQLVATFLPRGGMATLSPLGGAAFAGTLDLDSSAEFILDGRAVDFRFLGESVTVDLHGESPVFGGPYLGLAFPFGGQVKSTGDYFITARGVRGRRLQQVGAGQAQAGLAAPGDARPRAAGGKTGGPRPGQAAAREMQVPRG